METEEFYAFKTILPQHGQEIKLLKFVKVSSGQIMHTQIETAGFRNYQAEGWRFWRPLDHANAATERRDSN